ncbi:hypothetical protein M3Y99_00828300 [Aphelenchoides fujianensis]|nr:hypothetical protein M3Y99_00828300 [Aphelenchoides fujianensis]
MGNASSSESSVSSLSDSSSLSGSSSSLMSSPSSISSYDGPSIGDVFRAVRIGVRIARTVSRAADQANRAANRAANSDRRHAYKIVHGRRPNGNELIQVFFGSGGADHIAMMEFGPGGKQWSFTTTDIPGVVVREESFRKSLKKVRKIFEDYDPPAYFNSGHYARELWDRLRS